MQGKRQRRQGVIGFVPMLSAALTLLLTSPAVFADATGWYGGVSLGKTKSGLSLQDAEFAGANGNGLESVFVRQDTAYKARLGYDFANGLAVFGKVGLILSDNGREAAGIRASLSDKSGRTLPGVGLGLNYSLSKSLGLRAEWEKYYRSNTDLNARPDIGQLSVGVRLNFR